MKNVIYWIIISAVALGLIFGGLFLLNPKREESFYKSYNLMNENYKKVLFATGQEKEKSKDLYQEYFNSWSNFYNNYRDNPISPYSKDLAWFESQDKINSLIIESGKLIDENKLHEAHLKLEEVRGIWQSIFERNKVSMIGFYLTEFHDVMEKAVDGSENPDFVELSKICDELKEKWKKVESITPNLKGDEFEDYNNKKFIERKNIDAFCSKVYEQDASDLSSLSGKLKKDFISIYLAYG